MAFPFMFWWLGCPPPDTTPQSLPYSPLLTWEEREVLDEGDCYGRHRKKERTFYGFDQRGRLLFSVRPWHGDRWAKLWKVDTHAFGKMFPKIKTNELEYGTYRDQYAAMANVVRAVMDASQISR